MLKFIDNAEVRLKSNTKNEKKCKVLSYNEGIKEITMPDSEDRKNAIRKHQDEKAFPEHKAE